MSTQKEGSRKHYLKNKEKMCERSRLWYKENPEKRKVTKRKYYILHKDEILKREKLWRLKNPEQNRLLKNKWAAKNRKYLCLKSKKRHKEYPEYFRNWNRMQRINNINFKIRSNLRNRLYMAIKVGCRAGSAVHDLGCSIEELKIYLEKQFQLGMTWNNWSRVGWHIDHKMALANFDLTNREQFLIACHYTNLQPMWAINNLKKGNKII